MYDWFIREGGELLIVLGIFWGMIPLVIASVIKLVRS